MEFCFLVSIAIMADSSARRLVCSPSTRSYVIWVADIPVFVRSGGLRCAPMGVYVGNSPSSPTHKCSIDNIFIP